MEYSIPHLGMNTQFMYGGLGKVRLPSKERTHMERLTDC